MEVSDEKLKQRTYTISGMTFTLEEIIDEIRKYIPYFTVIYHEDQRLQKLGKYFRNGVIYSKTALLMKMFRNKTP